MKGITKDIESYYGKAVKIMFPGLGATPLGEIEKIILCLRAPRSVVLSRKNLISNISVVKDGKEHYGSEFLKPDATTYIEAMGRLMMWAGQVFWDKTFILHYEDVVSETEQTIRALCDFLGVEYNKTFDACVDKDLDRATGDDPIKNIDLAEKIYTALSLKDKGGAEDLFKFLTDKRNSQIKWVDEEHGTWLLISEAMESSLENNDKGVKDKLLDTLKNRNPIFKCLSYSRSDTEYSIKGHTRKKVLCRKDENEKTLEACYSCKGM
jgi:hypothetical protein